MKPLLSYTLVLGLLCPAIALADDAQIKSAESAGPSSLSTHATIMDWNKEVLRTGTNGWTCLPDNPDTKGSDPWCVNEPWLSFLDALKAKKPPTYTQVGIAFMLQGDSPVSNTDPYASKPSAGDDWVESLRAHMMILLPDRNLLKSFPTNSKNGGPWIMWSDTPYAHLMLPIDSYPSR